MGGRQRPVLADELGAWWRAAARGRAGGGRRRPTRRRRRGRRARSSRRRRPRRCPPRGCRGRCARRAAARRFAQASSRTASVTRSGSTSSRRRARPGSARRGGRRRASPPGPRRPRRAPGHPVRPARSSDVGLGARPGARGSATASVRSPCTRRTARAWRTGGRRSRPAPRPRSTARRRTRPCSSVPPHVCSGARRRPAGSTPRSRSESATWSADGVAAGEPKHRWATAAAPQASTRLAITAPGRPSAQGGGRRAR